MHDSHSTGRNARVAFVVLGALAVAALGIGGAFGEEEIIPSGPRAELREGYIGADACAECHTDTHASWTGSSHFHTFEPVGEDNLHADILNGATVEHAPGRSRFVREGKRYVVETTGPDGSPTRYDLTHVVGRMRVRMYVATLPDGRMQVLPAMLEVPTGTWFDYTKLIFGAPGSDWDTPPVVEPGAPSFWTGPVRSWDARCARCHVSGREVRERLPGQIGVRSSWRRLGVDCESCHGPGRTHADYHATHQGTDPMVRYRDLARDRAVSVCLQCHMEAEVHDSGFEIGDDVFEHVTPTLLVDPERVDPYGRPLELIYDGLPFSSSRCVQEGELTCITCHDPHGSKHRSQLREAAENDATCTECHAAIGRDLAAHTHHDPASSGSRCVSCHMPFLRIERGHGAVADHSISIPRLDLPGDRVAEDACTWCHTGGIGAPPKAPRLEKEALRKGYAAWWPDAAGPPAWAVAIAAARSGEADAAGKLTATAGDASAPRVARASAALLLQAYAKEVPLALLVLAADPDSLVRRSAVTSLAALEGAAVDAILLRAAKDPAVTVRVAAARAALEGWTRVQANETLRAAILPVLREDVAAAPDDEMRWFRLGAALDIHGDATGALEAYERMLALDPSSEHVKKRVEQLRAK